MLRRFLARFAAAPASPHAAPFLPLQKGEDFYFVPKARDAVGPEAAASGFPVPPQRLWLGYGRSVEEYLEPGRINVSVMMDLLGATGFALGAGSRILDFGCGAGRMIRWLADRAADCEIWGTDISAEHVFWCVRNLSPPFHFVVTTTFPHLPFEDGSFDLAYAGSVFTHIDDLAIAWFLELRRVLKPGGRLYATIQDRHSIELLKTRMRDSPLARRLLANPEFETFTASDFATFTIGRAHGAQVFYDIDFFRSLLSPLYDVQSVTPEAYGFQTAVILRKRI